MLDGLVPSSPGAARWWHWLVGVQAFGRVTLPVPARAITDGSGAVRGLCRQHALVLRREGPGARMRLDGRGRLVVPVWLRDAAAGTGNVLVAARRPDAAVVVVAPTTVLDGVADLVSGEVS